MESSTSLIVIMLLLVATGFFVAAEFTRVKIRLSKVETLAKETLSGKLLLTIKHNLEPYMAVCPLGTTMVSLGLDCEQNRRRAR